MDKPRLPLPCCPRFAAGSGQAVFFPKGDKNTPSKTARNALRAIFRARAVVSLRSPFKNDSARCRTHGGQGQGVVE